MIKKIVFLAAMSVSFHSHSACNALACEGVTNVILSSVKVDAESVTIQLPEGSQPLLNCRLVDSSAHLDINAVTYKNMQSMLLTAVASNLPIKLSFSTTSDTCLVSSLEIKTYE